MILARNGPGYLASGWRVNLYRIMAKTYMAKLAEITDKRTKGDVRRVRARLNKNCIFTGILDGTANAKNPPRSEAQSKLETKERIPQI